MAETSPRKAAQNRDGTSTAEPKLQQLPQPLWTASIQGKKLEVKCNRSRAPKRTVAIRGNVNSFSRAARLRLLKNLATFEWSGIGKSLFITLTYPDEVVHVDKEKRNRERYLFQRAIEEYTGKHVCGVWRVEWKERQSGANRGKVLPHIHLLLFGCEFLSARWLRATWKRILGYEGPLALDVQAVPAGEAASLYVAKYCSKEQSPIRLDNGSYLNTTGRHYGYLRSVKIPRHEPEELPVLSGDTVWFVRVKAQQRLKYLDLRKAESFTLLGDDAVKLANYIREKGLTGKTC